MQKRRGNHELNKAETPPEMHFPLTRATLTTCMHSKPYAQQVFGSLKNQTIFPLVRSLAKLLPLVGTCTH